MSQASFFSEMLFASIEDLGELSSYVKEEMNVQNLSICNDPLKYAHVMGEPDWKALGAKLGKAMGPVSKAIKALDVDALLKLEREGSILVADHEISSSEIKVRFYRF